MPTGDGVRRVLGGLRATLAALWARQYRWERVLWSLELSQAVSVLSRHRWEWSGEAWGYLRPENPRIRGVIAVVERRT